jgi:hypothetical protein
MRRSHPTLTRLCAAACVIALLVTACGGGSTAATHAPTAQAGAATAAKTTTSAGAAGATSLSVDALSCDAFPGQDVLSAFQTVAPKTTFKEAKTQTNSTGVLACDYELSAHESAGDHTVSLVVKMDDAVFTGDPTHDLSVNKDGFDKNRDNAIQNDVKGDATSDTQTIIVPATDLGSEAYFNDYFTRNSADHTNEAVRSYLSVLRANSPYLIDFDLSYSPLSEVGSNPGLSADADPFQNAAVHTMLTAVAQVFLATIDAAVLHPPVASTTGPTPTTVAGATSVPSGSGSGTTPLPEAKVKLRVVNLYTPAGQSAGTPVDAYFQRDASPSPQPGVDTPDIAAVAYGTASDYANVPDLVDSSVMVYTPGATETLAFQNFDGGNTGRYTLVLANGTDGQVTWQMFSELPTAAEVAQQQGLAAAPDGQALLVGDGIGLDRLTTVTGFTPGTADGCLAPEVQNGFNIPAGAGSVNYVSAPGAVQLAYYDALDSDCSQPPIVGPTAATLTAGERAYLLPFGDSKETLRLLVVPIPVLVGDPPLVALPTPTVTASVALPDACTLLSPDAVSAALGEPVTDTEGGADSGGCSWIGTHSSLGLGLQSDMDAATFAALMQGNGVTQSIDGLGDASYIVSDNTNRIFVLHGTTMLVLELQRHLDTGQDDASEDAGMLQSLAASVIAGLP